MRAAEPSSDASPSEASAAVPEKSTLEARRKATSARPPSSKATGQTDQRSTLSRRSLASLKRIWLALSNKMISRTARQRRREAERAKLIRASGLFDARWYLHVYPDVRDTGLDPVLHYLRYGAKEGRDPSRKFSTLDYRYRYLDVELAGVNPLLHFLEYGIHENRHIAPVRGPGSDDQTAVTEFLGTDDGGLSAEHARFTRPGPAYEDFDPGILNGIVPDVKVLAFYLPQYHPIPENDAFWGKGFTEWRQLARGLPRFPGHYQPRIPRDLGFYDLSEPDVMRRQAKLAKTAGIHGFGFYYYWFDGKRVLEKPVENFLASPDIDMPFMVIWANENWTRSWDGSSGEILLRQSYSPEHEGPLLADLARHFADPRHIRIDGRPLFIIYQPKHVPDACNMFARWRERWRSEYGLEPLIFMAQTFGVEDPRDFGLDGAMEFPPHKLTNALAGRPVPDAFSPTFAARVVKYDDLMAASLTESKPPYPLIKTLCPGWDNDARRPMRGMITEESTPRKYQRWLWELACLAKARPVFGDSVVAVNAWNEWAEGAYLEPDIHFGSAYLNATARALAHVANDAKRTSQVGVVLIGHDALDFGSQRLLHNIGIALTRCFGVRTTYLLFDGGPMVSQYETVAPCLIASPDSPGTPESLFSALKKEGFGLAIANTTVGGKVVSPLKAAGFGIVSLIHELPHLIRHYHLEKEAAAIARSSDTVVFAGAFVRDSFVELSGSIAGRAVIKPQGLYRTEIAVNPTARDVVRTELGLSPHATIVLNVGYGDWRKGYDLFARTAKEMAATRDDVFFVWVGRVPHLADEAHEPGDATPDNRNVIAVGQREGVAAYYAASDVFLLSSREDPYPSVVLEAMAAGLPVIGFAGATGCEELIAAHGRIVPAADISATAVAIGEVLAVPKAEQQRAAETRMAEIRANYDFKDYSFWLLQQLDPSLRRVSVLVPNYNHERYLADRLGSIFQQGYPVYEVIVLDDTSTDGSLTAIRDVAIRSRRDIAIFESSSNSGSIARQWRKGLDLCKGEYVWIAESDDVAAPEFLAECVKMLEDSQAGLCFADSWQIDGEGNRTGNSYIPYVDEIVPGTFQTDFVMEGPDFLRRFLAVKNVILNMSGVLWRREALAMALESAGAEIEDFKLAADWRLYFEACRLGYKVAYLAKAMNGHRRHRGGVTSSLEKQRHVEEIVRMQTSIAQAVRLDENSLSKAEKHQREVRRYLGLETLPDSIPARRST